MQTVFELNAREIDYSFFEAFQKLFKNQDVRITVEANAQKQLHSQMDMYYAMEKHRKQFDPIKGPKDININELVDQMYIEGNL